MQTKAIAADSFLDNKELREEATAMVGVLDKVKQWQDKMFPQTRHPPNGNAPS